MKTGPFSCKLRLRSHGWPRKHRALRGGGCTPGDSDVKAQWMPLHWPSSYIRLTGPAGRWFGATICATPRLRRTNLGSRGDDQVRLCQGYGETPLTQDLAIAHGAEAGMVISANNKDV